MKEQLTAGVRWTDKMHFWGRGDYGFDVPVDYSPPLGDGQGYGGLDLLLMSLAACSAQTVLPLLQKMKQDVRSFTATAVGRRRTEHPTVLTEIALTFDIEGNNLAAELIEKAVRLSEEKYCPVWAMLKPGVPISSSIKILPTPKSKNDSEF
jgi:putative redox protein